MGQDDRRCDHLYPEGHARAGERCGSRILPAAEDLCRLHLDPQSLARDRERVRLRRLEDRQKREPSDPAFYSEGWDRLDRPIKECAERFEINHRAARRWYAWEEFQQALRAAAGRTSGEFPAQWWDLTEDHIPALVDDFAAFRRRFFKTPRRRRFLTPEFQRRWVSAVIRALVLGGRQVILSPPRHGKTELLIHFCVWLICRWPDIRILWVGGNEDIATRSVGMVAGHLAGNEELIEAYAGEGRQFRPRPKDGLPWSKSEFTVATRTDVQKGRTMTALGRGGTLLSLDADIIVCDDIEDHGSTAQPGARQATRDWWTSQLESRKEEDTALFVIGSRQHPDDLAGHLVTNPEYLSITETAHDPVCELPDEPFDAHVECMLFAELRSYRYLMSQKRASESGGGEGIFRMVYLNLPSDPGLQVFTPEIVDPCRDPAHVVGRIPSPFQPPGAHPSEVGGVSLVAGLDPAGTGYQAAFLWAYQVRPELRMWMVDLENREGGGIAAARQTIRDWYETYRVSHWVVEENLYHGGIVSDEKIVEFCGPHGIRLEGFRTYQNKADPRLGVTTLAPLFASGQIILPYGDAPSKAKTDTYRRQLIYWDGSAPRNRNTRTGPKTDLVMASWFPMDVIRREQTQFIAEMGVDYQPEYGSFTGYDWNEVPWESPDILGRQIA